MSFVEGASLASFAASLPASLVAGTLDGALRFSALARVDVGDHALNGVARFGTDQRCTSGGPQPVRAPVAPCRAELHVEENALLGGFGSAVLEAIADAGMTAVRVKRIGIPDKFIEQGSQAQLRADLGIDAAGIAATCQAFLQGAGSAHPQLTVVK